MMREGEKIYKLLDLFCKAGGCSVGYHQAGFEVIGVDIEPQPNYPYKFIQADALTVLKDRDFISQFDVIHASPPCQKYTTAAKQWRLVGKQYPDFIDATRELLNQWRGPYVVENVEKAPLINPIMLCGSMFGLRTYRHRVFESNISLFAPEHPKHAHKQTKMGRPVKKDEYMQIVGHFSGVPLAREIMGCQWMNQSELAQAIPPAYTEWIGKQLIEFLNSKKAGEP